MIESGLSLVPIACTGTEDMYWLPMCTNHHTPIFFLICTSDSIKFNERTNGRLAQQRDIDISLAHIKGPLPPQSRRRFRTTVLSVVGKNLWDMVHDAELTGWKLKSVWASQRESGAVVVWPGLPLMRQLCRPIRDPLSWAMVAQLQKPMHHDIYL